MEKAREKFEIGQFVEILVRNSHQGQIGKVVAFDRYNEFNVKVEFSKGHVQGYMVNELRPIPKLGQERKTLIRSSLERIGKKLKELFN